MTKKSKNPTRLPIASSDVVFRSLAECPFRLCFLTTREAVGALGITKEGADEGSYNLQTEPLSFLRGGPPLKQTHHINSF